MLIFALAKWTCSIMDSALRYGRSGWGFESLQVHIKASDFQRLFFVCHPILNQSLINNLKFQLMCSRIHTNFILLPSKIDVLYQENM